MKKLYSLLLIAFTSLLIVGCSDDSSTPKVEDIPNPTTEFYVLDEAEVIPDDVEKEMVAKAKKLEDVAEKPQVVFVTTNDLKGFSLEEYATELFNKWGIGDDESDNGVLFLYVPETDNYRLEVGYGLEGAITDAQAGEILDSTIAMKEEVGLPEAFDTAQDSILSMIGYEYLSAEEFNNLGFTKIEGVESSSTEEDSDFPIILFIIIFLIVFTGVIGGGSSGGGYSGGYSGGGYSGSSGGGFSGGSFGGGGSSGGGGASR